LNNLSGLDSKAVCESVRFYGTIIMFCTTYFRSSMETGSRSPRIPHRQSAINDALAPKASPNSSHNPQLIV